MIRLTLAEVARACGGQIAAGTDPAVEVTGPVVVDSRLVTPGALYVALPGERVDGHDFAAAAVAADAAAVLATRDVGVPAVLVQDAQAALGRLARHVCDRLTGLTVVGVTGSSGKTSTKDLLAHLLADLGPTVAPQNSFNNEIGVPLTALQCTEQTRYLVAEMGARHPGNISYLCSVAPPRIAVVLNIGTAHLGEFGSTDVTARTKGELVEALPEDGVAVLNGDDPLVRAMASRTRARVVLTGRGDDCDVRAVDVTLDDQARARFVLTAAGRSAAVALRLHGEHHVANAVSAAAVALEAGLAVERVAELLSTATPASKWRMAVQERADGLVLVNDAYNANPDSVAAALRALATMTADGRRAWAVLGEMLELGDLSATEHERAGRFAAQLGIGHLVAVGPGALPVVAWAAGDAGATSLPQVYAVDGPDAALDLLDEQLRPGDVVLVKASRGIGLDRLAAQLMDPARVTVRRSTTGGAPLTDDRLSAGQDGGRVRAGARTSGGKSAGGEVTA